MHLNINGHDVSATIGADSERVSFQYRHPESGRLDYLSLDLDEMISALGSLEVPGLTAPPPSTPSDPPPNAELPPHPHPGAAIGELAGDAIDQMGGAFDSAHPADGHGDDVERENAAADAEREIDADEAAAHRERPDADAPQS